MFCLLSADAEWPSSVGMLFVIWDGHNWSHGGAVSDLKRQGCKAILYITGVWPTLTDSQITVLFPVPASTTTPTYHQLSCGAPTDQNDVSSLGTNTQQQTERQVVIRPACFNCVVLKNSFYCAHELLYKLHSISNILFLSPSLSFSSDRTSSLLLLSLLLLNTVSENTKVCGL